MKLLSNIMEFTKTYNKTISFPEEFILDKDFFEFKKGTHFKVEVYRSNSFINNGFKILLINGTAPRKVKLFKGNNILSMKYSPLSLNRFLNMKAFI